MPSQTQITFDSYQKWHESVIQKADWEAEKNFIGSKFTVHDSNGIRIFSPSEWERERNQFFSDGNRIEINDLIIKKEKLCCLYTLVSPAAETGKVTLQGGIQIIRYEDGKMAETWIAVRPSEEGAWPKTFKQENWSFSDSDEITESEKPVFQAMIRYQEIRWTHEAEGLRDLFIEPMIIHGPGPTRTESLDELVERVKNEPKAAPGLKSVWNDMFVANNKAVMRWTYIMPPPVSETIRYVSGQTLYQFEKGKIVERWQAEIPRGMGWSDT